MENKRLIFGLPRRPLLGRTARMRGIVAPDLSGTDIRREAVSATADTGAAATTGLSRTSATR